MLRIICHTLFKLIDGQRNFEWHSSDYVVNIGSADGQTIIMSQLFI